MLPNCDECGMPQAELGALEFSPPDKDGKCLKRHVCVQCWNRRAAQDPEKVPWSRVKSVVKHADGYHITLRPNGFEVERKPLKCPKCNSQHVDRGEWAKRPHHKHLCEYCGHEWRVEPYMFGIAPEPDLTVGPEPAQGDRERAIAYYHYLRSSIPHAEGPKILAIIDATLGAIDWDRAEIRLAALLAEVRAEERERCAIRKGEG